MRLVAAFACAVMLICLVVPGHAEKRVALVIGNDRYANLPSDQQLRKAVNDARSVGDALGSLGFEVIRGENLGRQALVDKFDELTQRLSPGDTAFFFFSGHGVAINGGNYILPVDVPNAGAGQDMRLAHASFGESDIVSELQGRGVRVAVVVLDACRNNPFKQPGAKGVGAERGLGRIEPVQGVFTLYSAGLGQTALDRLSDADSNPNSVFTRVFVPALTKPGLGLSDLALEVREEVSRLAASVQHNQRPAYYDETIGGRVYLAGLPGNGAQLPIAQTPATDPAERAWAVTQSTTSVAVLEDFIRQFGGTPYGSMARARLDELKKSQVAVIAPGPIQPTVPKPASPPVAVQPSSQSAVFTSGGSLGPTSVLPSAPPSVNFPTKPIKIIVPFAPGGGVDITARIVAQKMSETLGQAVIIENKGGAGGAVGAAAAKNASPDGYTLLMASIGTHVLVPALSASPPYDARVDFAPVGLVAAAPVVIAAKKDIPAADLRSFIAFLKANPGRASYGSTGTGGTEHVACAEFNRLIGADSAHVPYRGSAPLLQDLIAGQIDYACVVSSAVSSAGQANVKALAIASLERSPKLEGVPTTQEAGLPSFQVYSWVALFAPKGSPQPVLQRISFALSQALEDSKMREQLAAVMSEIPNRSNRSPEALAAFLRAEAEKWGGVIKAAGIASN